MRVLCCVGVGPCLSTRMQLARCDPPAKPTLCILPSSRVARAHLTLAQGYRQLRGLNEQSIQHAKIALNMAKRMTKRGEHEVGAADFM